LNGALLIVPHSYLDKRTKEPKGLHSKKKTAVSPGALTQHAFFWGKNPMDKKKKEKRKPTTGKPCRQAVGEGPRRSDKGKEGGEAVKRKLSLEGWGKVG